MKIKKTVNAIEFKTVKAKSEALKGFGIGSMFSVGADAKTVKGEKLGFDTAILYMLPNDKLCPAAKIAGCRDACLVSAGRGAFNSVKTARHNKTELFNKSPETFYGALITEIKQLTRTKGESLVIRLNGTSDIDYENQPIKYKGKTYSNIFALFPAVKFYDYTKRVSRLNRIAEIGNYHITLSYSEARQSYANSILRAAKAYKVNAAVVFKGQAPNKFKSLPVTDGDESDLRFLDEISGGIVALKAKGKAKQDKSGFVIIATDKTS
jgi:hypothetical protein